MEQNKVRQALGMRKPVIGTFICTGSPNVVELLGHAGLDFVIIDMEHSCIGTECAEQLIRAAEATDIVPFVRPTKNDKGLIQRALDSGALGVVIPGGRTGNDAKAAVDASRYHPKGRRGAATPRSIRYGVGLESGKNLKDVLQEVNKEIMVIFQIETETAVDNLSEILAVEGIDVAFVGPFDLSQSLGIPGEFDHSRQQEAIRKVLSQGKKVDMSLGMLASNANQANHYIDMGFRFIVLSWDIGFLYYGCSTMLQSLRHLRKDCD